MGREKKDRTVLSVSYMRRPIPECIDADPIRKVLETPASPPAKHPKALHDIDNAMEMEAPSTAGPAAPLYHENVISAGLSAMGKSK